jgi:HAD superfamily hydrolase (TIGR01450 family)
MVRRRKGSAVAEPRALATSETPLMHAYDCVMLDLDGVVYLGTGAIDGVPGWLEEARSAGMRVAFVTNNAARTPEQVAAHLTSLGVHADSSDVVTSAQAAAGALAGLLPSGARVLVVGGEGLESALVERGLRPVWSADDDPAAVVQGFHPTVGWSLLAEGGYAVRRGIPWIVSNTDLTVPTARGIAPGNGTFVRAVAAASGRQPTLVAGKPYRPLFDETVERVGATRPLIVGDRLDTDIEGASNTGTDALLVLTGVTDLAAACCAAGSQRPAYVCWTLRGLTTSHRAPDVRDDGGARLAGWDIGVEAGRLTVRATGTDADDGLRAVVQAAWWYNDNRPDDARLEGLEEVGTALNAARVGRRDADGG